MKILWLITISICAILVIQGKLLAEPITPLYNSTGHAIAYIDRDGTSIFLFSGKPVCWLAKDDSLYTYSGKWLGWMEKGWIFDRKGKRAFFTDSARGGPGRPARSANLTRRAKNARPTKAGRESHPSRPTRSLSWSRFSGIMYFNQ